MLTEASPPLALRRTSPDVLVGWFSPNLKYSIEYNDNKDEVDDDNYKIIVNNK